MVPGATMMSMSSGVPALTKQMSGMNSFNNRYSSMFMTLDAILKQVTVALEVVLDIDFAGIENVRRLYDTLG